MKRSCSILLVAASMCGMAWAQGSGSTRPAASKNSGGGGADAGPDLSFMVTRTVKGKIAEIKKDDHGAVVIVEDSEGRRGAVKVNSKTRIKADKKTEYAGKKHISPDDLEVGQIVKITFIADSGQVLEVRLTAKT